jgi:hypothetical protein
VAIKELGTSYQGLQKDPQIAELFIGQKTKELKASGHLDWYYQQLAKESSLCPDEAYPGQGLVITHYEEPDHAATENLTLTKLSSDLINSAIHGWLYYLELFNHPERLEHLFQQSEKPFQAPKAKFHPAFFLSRILKRSITINDLKLNASGSHKPRTQRSEAHLEGVFVSYGRRLSLVDRLQNKFFKTAINPGRRQARNVTIGAANPEITGSPMALATLAQAHSLVCVPRDGFFADINRQADLVTSSLEWLQKSPLLNGKSPEEQNRLLDFWRHNLVGVIESKPEKALNRAEALYQAGLRTFRIYSPEPSSGPLETLKALRSLEKDKGWEPIEIFVGQVVDIKQALKLEKAGANALYFGIGGGGRCITGVVAGLTINWPELVWRLRGKIQIPMIVEGGANDHIPETLAVGASGIGTAGKFAGTIETPGGYLFIEDPDRGTLFKYYGGEASDRMRIMANRSGPLGFVLNREGETRRKELRNGGHDLPTLLQVLYEQQQGIVAGLVFQNVSSITEFQDRADNLRQASPNDDVVRQPH